MGLGALLEEDLLLSTSFLVMGGKSQSKSKRGSGSGEKSRDRIYTYSSVTNLAVSLAVVQGASGEVEGSPR